MSGTQKEIMRIYKFQFGELRKSEFHGGKIIMNKRTAGVMFCLIAGELFAIRYIVAALFMSGVSSWNAMNFAAGLEYQGNGLLIFSIISLVVGIVYLVRAEIEDKRK